LIRFTILLIALTSSGCAVGPAPKVDTCITYMYERYWDCKNNRGTKFKISFDTKNEDDKKYMNTHISAPSDQIIDLMAWIKKAMLELQNSFLNKTGK
jgi:hypothetical protein